MGPRRRYAQLKGPARRALPRRWRGLVRVALTLAAFGGIALAQPLVAESERAPWALRVAQLEPAAYELVAITAPKPEQTIHDNLGRVDVEVVVRPSLQSERGHRVRLLLDGQPVSTTAHAGRIVLADTERGTHVLQAVVIDRDGRELLAGDPVTFHMWRASVLFPQRPDRPKSAK